MTASDVQSPDDIGSDQVNVTCTVNGKPAAFSVPPHRTLMDALRYQLGLTGTKTCCAEGECGACTVIIDGAGVNSCLMLAAEAEGATSSRLRDLAPRSHAVSATCRSPSLKLAPCSAASAYQDK